MSASTIRVAINLGSAASAFWVKTPWSMMPLFVHQLGDFAKYPITIYSVGGPGPHRRGDPVRLHQLLPDCVVFGVEAWSRPGC